MSEWDNNKFLGAKQRSTDGYFLAGSDNSATTVGTAMRSGHVQGTQQINITALTETVIAATKTITFSITSCDTIDGTYAEIDAVTVTAGTYAADHQFHSYLINADEEGLFFKVTSTPSDATPTGTTDAFVRILG